MMPQREYVLERIYALTTNLKLRILWKIVVLQNEHAWEHAITLFGTERI